MNRCDLFRRLAFCRATTSRARRTWTFRCGNRLVLRAGLLFAAAGSEWLAAEEYLQTDVNKLPMQPAIGPTASRWWWRFRRGRIDQGKVWQLKVGRCDLLLLDSNVPATHRGSRADLASLCGDGRTRIRQELLLGVGGFRALKAMAFRRRAASE